MNRTGRRTKKGGGSWFYGSTGVRPIVELMMSYINN